MSVISISNLAKSYGAEDIFSGVTFSIARGARLALVGPNGCGKTTLLRILIGEEEPSSGTVAQAKNTRLGYLPQEAEFLTSETLWEECLTPFADLIAVQAELHSLETRMADPEHAEAAIARYGPLQQEFERRGGYNYPTRIRQVLTGLGFLESDFTMRIDHLSGGQRTRAYLARLLLSDPDLLLLDEPTNHLDIAAVEWLEGYLSQWEGAAVIVSHDRYFLDRVANVVLEMNHGLTELYRGNYSAYLQQREARWSRREEVFVDEKEKLLKEVEYIKKNISGQNVSQAKGKLRRLTRVVQAIEQVGLEAVLNTQWSQLDVETTTSPFSVEEAERRVRALRPPVRTLPKLKLHLAAPKRSGELVIRSRDLQVGFPDRLLFSTPDIELRRLECAALIGPNGAGKSTFLKTILGNLEPLAGEVIMGASLQIGYFAQAHEGLDPEKTVVQEIQQTAPQLYVSEVRDYLGRYLFSGDDVFKKVELLSGGERGRLALAKLALQDTNLLLLDEPTNHLDILSQEVLESVLDDYGGTILLVSHDRYLIDSLATQIWEIDPDETELMLFKGTYSQLKEYREKEAARLAEENPQPDHRQVARQRSNSGKEERRRIALLQELENQIAAMENQLAELGRKLEDPPDDPAEVARLGAAYTNVQRDMDRKLDEWEKLH